jgi:hypothetical protein
VVNEKRQWLTRWERNYLIQGELRIEAGTPPNGCEFYLGARKLSRLEIWRRA